MLKEPEKDCRGAKRLPVKLLLSGTAYFENRPVAVKGPGASDAASFVIGTACKRAIAPSRLMF